MSGTTTIQVDVDTRKRLTKFKEYSRETYDEILNKLMSIVENIKGEEGEFTEETKKGIERGRADIRAGRHFSTKELLKELGAD